MRTWIKRNLPFLRPVVRAGRRVLGVARRNARALRRTFRRRLSRGLPGDSMEKRFDRIYRMNLWRGDESRCGPGSSLEETAVVRAELPGIVRRLGVRSLLDIPCGDFFWMKEVPLSLDAYIGAEVVSRLARDNTERYGAPNRSFVCLDIRDDPLPRVDLVLCRDCLDHFCIADIQQALANIVRSGATYLLATTYPDRELNPDIRSGDWRPLNLLQPPFGLPDPMELVNEGSSKPGYPDKSLGLWRIRDIAAPSAEGWSDTTRLDA